MIDKNKADPELGRKVRAHLKSLGFLSMEKDEEYNYEERRAKLEALMKQVVDVCGLVGTDCQLIETPKRISKYWIGESMAGLNWDWFPKCTMFETNGMSSKSFVIERDIEIRSLCAHHFAPFFGLQGGNGHYTFGPGVTVAYIPKGKLIGISKLARIVEFLAARPSNQEELSGMILETLKFVLGTEDVAVFIKAFHSCMTLRGINSSSGSTTSASMSGTFQTDDKIRSEFLSLARQ